VDHRLVFANQEGVPVGDREIEGGFDAATEQARAETGLWRVGGDQWCPASSGRFLTPKGYNRIGDKTIILDNTSCASDPGVSILKVVKQLIHDVMLI
jgi:hypothetical protein